MTFSSQPPSRIPELDGIRGLAIFMVLVWHYFNSQLIDTDPAPAIAAVARWTSFGWTGVDLFFVLSGFLIGGILLDHHRTPNFLKVFWIRRACRILPVFLVLFLVYFSIRSFLDADRYAWLLDDPMPSWSYLTFTQNIFMGLRESFGSQFVGVSWSLAIEEQFYLIAPVAIVLLRARWWVRLLAPMFIVAILLRLCWPGLHAFVWTPFRMDSILAGAGAAALVRSPAAVRELQARPLLLGAACLVFLVAAWFSIFRDALTFMNHSWLALGFAAFILLAILKTGAGWLAPLRLAPLRFLGLTSYAVYLFHQAVSGLLHGYFFGEAPRLEGASRIATTGAALFLTIGLASLSWFLMERRLLGWGRRFSYLPDDNGREGRPRPSAS